ncbi:MAG: hypothetical protein CME65_08020 [Halobacteriovoraceae bacterium]|nr:hypothetical protein [Halobacteriovoraceae bacterium]
MALVIAGVIIAAVIFYIIGLYNKMVRLSNGYKNAFSQIDVQLQRRYELIPNLVEVAKKYMAHERETLEAVIQARNQALQAKDSLKSDPSNTQAAQKFAKSEGALNASMGGFLALFENYPDLKANDNMKSLMEELTSTENKVGFARQSYNDSVMNYNVGIQEFPANILAGSFGFRDVPQLEIEDEKMRSAVKVEF